MAVDYPSAIDRIITDPAWVFTDALKGLSGNDLSIVNHKTASNSQNSALDEANFFHNDTKDHKSVHFVIGRDGVVVQVVQLKDGAGGNCCLETGHDPYWDAYHAKYGNLNTCTISIEHVDWTSDNSQPMTQAQIDASFKLNLWLCQRFGIPVSHIKGHSSLDPQSKARCPGPTYPMADLLGYVQQHLGGVILAELPHFPHLSQQTSVTSDSQYSENAAADCVYASIGMCIQYFRKKASWDTDVNPDLIKDVVQGQGYVGGGSAALAVSFCAKFGLDLVEIHGTNTELVSAMHKNLQAGFPSILTIVSIYDSRWWHVHACFKEIAGGLVAVDPYPLPNGIDQAKSDSSWINLLQTGSIWVVKPTGAFPMTLPTGAKDNGKDTITFSNGKVMVRGFRAKYLEMAAAGRVPPDDLALDNEHHEDVPEKNNPSYWPHGGNVQTTRFFRFAWSPEHGVVVTYVGAEVLWYQNHQVAPPPPVVPLPPSTPQVIVDDISKLVAGFEQLKKDAGVI